LVLRGVRAVESPVAAPGEVLLGDGVMPAPLPVAKLRQVTVTGAARADGVADGAIICAVEGVGEFGG
jgi:hypothetical protein